MEHTIGTSGVADPAGNTQFIVDLDCIITVGVEVLRFADCVLWAVVDAQAALLAPLRLEFYLHEIPSNQKRLFHLTEHCSVLVYTCQGAGVNPLIDIPPLADRLTSYPSNRYNKLKS